MELIDEGIGHHHLARQRDILVHEGVEAAPDHVAHRIAHRRDIHGQPLPRQPVELDRGLGDVDRQVSHALEIGHHLEGGGNAPEIAGRRLPEREDPETELVDFLLEMVNLAVTLDHRLRPRRVALGERRQRIRNQPLHMRGHPQELGAQIFEILLELARQMPIVGLGFAHG